MSFRQVEFNGRLFPSIVALSRATGVPQSTLRRRLDEGRILVPADEEAMGPERRSMGLVNGGKKMEVAALPRLAGAGRRT